MILSFNEVLLVDVLSFAVNLPQRSAETQEKELKDLELKDIFKSFEKKDDTDNFA